MILFGINNLDFSTGYFATSPTKPSKNQMELS